MSHVKDKDVFPSELIDDKVASNRKASQARAKVSIARTAQKWMSGKQEES